MALPTLAQFLPAARAANPGVPDKALATYWQDNYYSQGADYGMPTWDEFLPKAKQANPNVPEASLKQYWHDTYGAQGVPESAPSTTVGDVLKSGAAGTLNAVGETLHGLAAPVAAGINAVADTDLRAVDPLKSIEDALEESRSAAGKHAEHNFQLSGDTLDPTTWRFHGSWGGAAQFFSRMFGAIAPQAILALMTGGASTEAQALAGAAVGGAQGYGMSATQEREFVENAPTEQLAQQSTFFKNLMDQGVPEDQAREATAKKAELGGGLGQGIPFALQGALQQLVLKMKLPLSFGEGAVKTASGVAAGAAGQAALMDVAQRGQNVLSNEAIGGNRPAGEGTLAAAVSGAALGVGLGGYSAARGHTAAPIDVEKEITDKVMSAPTVDAAIAAATAAAEPGPVLGGHASGAEVLPVTAEGVQGTPLLGRIAGAEEVPLTAEEQRAVDLGKTLTHQYETPPAALLNKNVPRTTEPAALPAPRMVVTPAGEAATDAQRAEAAARLERLGLTPDVFAAQQAHPGLARPAAPEPAPEAPTPIPRKSQLLDAIVRLGGINSDERPDVIGDTKGNHGIPGVGYVFNPRGESLDGMAEKLTEQGWFTEEQRNSGDATRLLSNMVRDEIAGAKYHVRPGQLGDLDGRMRAEMERYYEDRPATEEADPFAHVTPSDLAVTGYNKADDATKDLTALFAVGRREMGDDKFEALTERVATRHPDISDDEFERIVRQEIENHGKQQAEVSAANRAGAENVPAALPPGQETHGAQEGAPAAEPVIEQPKREPAPAAGTETPPQGGVSVFRSQALTPVSKRGELYVEFEGKRYPVKSLEDASRKWDEFRGRAIKNGAGASDVPPASVTDGSGKLVGHIAWNGRIFEGRSQDWTGQTKLLYDNRQPAKEETLLPKSQRVDTSKNVPFLGGTSKDGKTVYLDKAIPTTLNIDGKDVDVRPFIVAHETAEKALLDQGMQYPAAHEQATAKERVAVESAGIKWDSYEKALAPYISRAEHAQNPQIPHDLETKPYTEGKNTPIEQTDEQEVKEVTHATPVRSNTGQVREAVREGGPKPASGTEGGQDHGGENIQRQPVSGNATGNAKGASGANQPGHEKITGELKEPESVYTDKRPVFYSQMRKSLDAKLPNSGNAEQFRLQIGNLARKGEFKNEEYEWSGINQWLSEQKGKVTKQQILDFVRSNEVQVKEIKLGGRKEIVNEISNITQNHGTSVSAVENLNHDSFQRKELRRLGQDFTDKEVARLKALHEQLANLEPTKFENWQLPGGENYRELLLTLPTENNSNDALAQRWFQKPYSDLQPNERDFINREAQIEPPKGEFRSSHFDEPNVLAHVRFNDRTDADGKKVLFVEEVQSDWHQKGRKGGYQSEKVSPDTTPKESNIELKFVPPTVPEGHDPAVYPGYWESFDKRNGELITRHPGRMDRADAMKEAIQYGHYALQDRIAANTKRAPDAPFKTTWPMLAMKRMIRYAAENGYDRIAWTTGEQQAARYDLSKVINRLNWYLQEDGNYKITADTKERGVAMPDQIVAPDKLADVVGKDVADKIIKGDGARAISSDETEYKAVGELSGLDLKVGGEGMKGFYDQMLPNEINKYVKKWGGKVGETDITTPGGIGNWHYEGPSLTWHEVRALARDKEISAALGTQAQDVYHAMRDGGLSFEEAIEKHGSYALAERFGGKLIDDVQKQSVHSLDITPEMRDSVMQGQPMFDRTGATATSEEAPSVLKNRKEETPAAQTLREAVEHAVGKTLEKGAFTDVGVPESFRPVADAVKKIFGKDVVFFRNNIPDVIRFGGLATGLDTKNVYVNVDHKSPFVYVTGHELLHLLRKDRPDLYNKLLKVAQQEFRPEAVEQFGGQLGMFAERNKLSFTYADDKIKEEMLANFVGDNFGRPVFWAKLAAQDHPMFLRLARTVYDYLKNLLIRAKAKVGAGSYNSASYFRDLERMRDAAGQALKEYAEHNRLREPQAGTEFAPEAETEYQEEPGPLRTAFDRLAGRVQDYGAQLREAYARPPEMTESKKAIGRYTGALQKIDYELMRLAKDVNTRFPKSRQEAITNYIQQGGDTAALAERAGQVPEKYRQGYIDAQHLTPEEKQFADQAHGRMDALFQEAHAAGVVEDYLHNYVRQEWERPDQAGKKIIAQANAGVFKINPREGLRRVFRDYAEGEAAGYVPKNKSIGYQMVAAERSLRSAIETRKALRTLMDSREADGRPTVMVGIGGTLAGEPDFAKKQAYYVKPNVKPEYGETADYRYLNHPALRKWQWIDEESGHPMMREGNMWIHPDAYGRLNALLGRSRIRDYAIPEKYPIVGGMQPGRMALEAGAFVKGTILIGPFHQFHLAEHALFHKVNPFNVREIDFEKRPLLLEGVEHGLMLYNHNAMSEFGEGLATGGMFHRIPIVGDYLKRYQEWLFQDYIPRLKAEMFEHAVSRAEQYYAKDLASGKLTRDQLLDNAAKQANAAFGEQNYKYMGRNPTLQDALRLGLLAPDFLESRFRFFGQAARPYGREQLMALVRGAAIMAAAAQTVNLLFGDEDKDRWKHPFSIHVGGYEYTPRSVVGDMAHLVQDPRGFWYHRLNPLWGRPVLELATGRNQQGQKVGMEDAAKDIAKSWMPIPGQGFFKRNLGNTTEQSIVNGLLQSIGVSNYPYKTAAERMISDISFNHMQVGAQTETQKHRHEVFLDLLAARKAGAGMGDIMEKAREKDVRLSPIQLRELSVANLNSRSGQVMQFRLRTRSFSPEEMMQVWGEMTADERQEYGAVVRAKVMASRTATLEDKRQYLDQLRQP